MDVVVVSAFLFPPTPPDPNPIPIERYASLQPVVVAIYVKESNARMQWGPTRTAWVVAVMRGVHRRSLLVAIAKLDS